MDRSILSLCLLSALVGNVSGLLFSTSSENAGKGCANLENQGSHFTVEVGVGTPPQKFDIVADTGSNTLIVPSCLCAKHGTCDASAPCFQGTDRSSSFMVEVDKMTGQTKSMVLSFGSGDIMGAIAKDMVTVGGVKAYMEDGLMLMTDKRLNIQGAFAGILGLGIPAQAQANPTAGQTMRVRNPVPEASPKGFLEQSEIGKFSICFNPGSDGVLRIGHEFPPQAIQHTSLGTSHWGLGLAGISVSKGQGARTRLQFCSDEDKPAGQDTPCGAIPDSGTTLFMGPQGQVTMLLESICDGWERCRKYYADLKKRYEEGLVGAPQELYTKADTFQMLLFDCEKDYPEYADLMAELPDVYFHVTGKGTEQAVKISPKSWVMEVPAQQMYENTTSMISNMPGVFARLNKKDPFQGPFQKGPFSAPFPKKKEIKACTPAFGAMAYETKANGPVWILGTGLFYEHIVNYNMLTSPPTLTLTEQSEIPCGSCSGMDFLLNDAVAARARNRPMRVDDKPRMPSYDFSNGL